jgi:rare lipoprotein A
MRRFLILSLVLAVAACAGRRPRPGTPRTTPHAGTVQEGVASWYGLEEKGRPTASGEIMDPERFTAAHKTYPFGTVVRVDDLDTGRSVVVVINDRGPFVEGRIIDLSYAPALALGMVGKGVARVRIQVVGEESGHGIPYTWRVQVGAFVDERRARDLAEALRQERYSPVLVQAQKQGPQVLYKVWVGEFNDRLHADRVADRLRLNGRSAIVVSTKIDP